MQNLIPPGATCVTGVVTVFETALLGAVNGVISPVVGTPVFFTQVVGPAGGAISLQDLNGQFATACGTFVMSNGRPVLNVSFAAPAGSQPLGMTQQGALALLTRLLQFGGFR